MSLMKNVISEGDGVTFAQTGDNVGVVHTGWLYQRDAVDNRGRRCVLLVAGSQVHYLLVDRRADGKLVRIDFSSPDEPFRFIFGECRMIEGGHDHHKLKLLMS